ncbi:hypothetical protein KAR91_52195 [Candidatus Pacearchaeota archaeon]|nr:hypothetical protein [Candidatus Pacearchaeota archaeon]
MKPYLCSTCPFWIGTGCSIVPRHAIGYIDSCPHIDKPVLNEYGHTMNPPWDEKYLLSDGHVFLFPEKIDPEWVIKYTIFKKGAGTCGIIDDPLFIMVYKKAMAEIIEDRRITDADREILSNPFSDRRVFNRREVLWDTVQDEPEAIPWISISENIDASKTGDQMELF